MAARFHVIILEKPDSTNANLWRYLLWCDVPTARQVYYKTIAPQTSAWKDAIQVDTDAIKNGEVLEYNETLQHPAGTNMATMQSMLQQLWTDKQNFVNTWNPYVRYGSTFDGTAWVLTNIG